MALTALITRPDDDAEPLAAALIARGITVVREPLLAVKPVADAVVDLEGVQALLFTSANGVRAFANLSQRRDLPVFAVGDNTARTARATGFDNVESAAGAVDDLARLVARRLDPKRGALFHAAGSAVAGDLAGLLSEKGFELRRVMLYSADQAAALTDDARTRLEHGEIGLVLLFSPRTAETFVTLVRGAGDAAVQGIGQATALCLSPAVEKAAQGLPWRSLLTAEKADLPSMLRLVDQAAEAARPVVSSAATRDTANAGDTPAPADIEAALKRMARRPPPARRFALVAGLLILVVAVVASRPLWQPFIDRLTTTSETVVPASTDSAGTGTTSTAAGASNDTSLAAVKAEAAQLESDLALMQAAMERAATERQAQWERIGALEKQMGDLSPKLDALVKAQAELQDKMGQQTSGAATAAPALPEDIAALPGEIADLRAKLESLAAAAAPAPAPAPSEGSADNAALSNLQTSLDRLSNENASLKAALDQATQRLSALDQLQQENAALKATLDQTAQRLTALEARPVAATGEAKNAALLLATAQLKSAIAAGRPFNAELQAVDGLAADDDGLADVLTKAHLTLGNFAPQGLPTASTLLQQVPGLVDAALETSGGALAETPSGKGWLDRLLSGLSKLVKVRPSDGTATGDNNSDRLARAENAAAAGDLAATKAALDGLTGPAADGVKSWRENAAARLAADSTLDGLEQAALARVAASPSTGGG
ncbi:uroporphyrinogen III methyltransferase [Hypericibacter terrae]|uniref:Uroporphyrinogen-III synthase n=1 Tax=Hypericibacter terrae TaxID=2602015 RepID=A0A5J6MTF8_9PROT|nr:uroporphyrinogen-III synthase [Hypericibacter terrae]QEX20005.1 uroporphyrinogen III methyltransferase [Hypericibacter terrae]